MASRSDLQKMIRRLVLASAADGRVSCLWLEGDSLADAQSPSNAIDAHVALADPDHEPFFRGHESFLRSCGTVVEHEDEEVPNGGRLCMASFPGNVRVRLSMERRSLLAKRLRKAVVPLEDKMGGQLRYVLSYAPGHQMGT